MSAPPADEAQAEAAEAGYLAPPRVEQVAREGSLLVFRGMGPPNARIRLTGAGGAYGGTADRAGRWRIETPAGSGAGLFSLAAEQGERLLEGEGRMLVLPDGPSLLLRPGHGALPLAEGGVGPPRIISVDVASDGAAAVSGLAQPSASAVTRLDGVPPDATIAVGSGATDSRGRFSIILGHPLQPGPHLVEVNTPSGAARAELSVVAPDPAAPPFSAHRQGGGWRVAWKAPGGGVQTTYVLPGTSS